MAELEAKLAARRRLHAESATAAPAAPAAQRSPQAPLTTPARPGGFMSPRDPVVRWGATGVLPASARSDPIYDSPASSAASTPGQQQTTPRVGWRGELGTPPGLPAPPAEPDLSSPPPSAEAGARGGFAVGADAWGVRLKASDGGPADVVVSAGGLVLSPPGSPVKLEYGASIEQRRADETESSREPPPPPPLPPRTPPPRPPHTPPRRGLGGGSAAPTLRAAAAVIIAAQQAQHQRADEKPPPLPSRLRGNTWPRAAAAAEAEAEIDAGAEAAERRLAANHSATTEAEAKAEAEAAAERLAAVQRAAAEAQQLVREQRAAAERRVSVEQRAAAEAEAERRLAAAAEAAAEDEAEAEAVQKAAAEAERRRLAVVQRAAAAAALDLRRIGRAALAEAAERKARYTADERGPAVLAVAGGKGDSSLYVSGESTPATSPARPDTKAAAAAYESLGTRLPEFVPTPARAPPLRPRPLPPAVLRVAVPAARTARPRSGGASFTVFVIVPEGSSKPVLRRYSDLRRAHHALKATVEAAGSGAEVPAFPPSSARYAPCMPEAAMIDLRREALQDYLCAIGAVPELVRQPCVRELLGLGAEAGGRQGRGGVIDV